MIRIHIVSNIFELHDLLLPLHFSKGHQSSVE